MIKFKKFDLNIGTILENWEPYHAIREIIANALDEQVITDTPDIIIDKRADGWHIIDFGRGINYHHLIQSENDEKIENDKLIGRFGVGLKDALATLYRHNIDIRIVSKYGIITLDETSKIGFEDVITLHAKIEETTCNNMQGTDFVITGCLDSDMMQAKAMFLKFSEHKILEENQYGQIIKTNGSEAKIYINGVKVAEEDNFLFSYNITSMNKQIKKALNRERSNVGRTAYSERVKNILLTAVSDVVIDMLVDDLQQYDSGLKHDELSWNDVALYATKKISERQEKVVFIAPNTAINDNSVVDDMKMEGYRPVILPSNLIEKIQKHNETKIDHTEILTTDKYIEKQEERKKYTFVEFDDLNENEKIVFNQMENIIALIGGKPEAVSDIKISESIYESELFSETVGLWDEDEKFIIVKRCQLKSLELFAGTLIHECIHASSGFGDVDRRFEVALTKAIGRIIDVHVIQMQHMDRTIYELEKIASSNDFSDKAVVSSSKVSNKIDIQYEEDDLIELEHLKNSLQNELIKHEIRNIFKPYKYQALIRIVNSSRIDPDYADYISEEVDYCFLMEQAGRNIGNVCECLMNIAIKIWEINGCYD